jgi:hypothetical protein
MQIKHIKGDTIVALQKDQKIIVDCGEGQDAYQVTLTGTHWDPIKGATIKNPDLDGKKGEALVAAIFAIGNTMTIERKTLDGKFNDGPNGEAAVEEFVGDENALMIISHYKNGKRHDGINGEFAQLTFSSRGLLENACSYREGVLVKELTERELEQYNIKKLHEWQKLNNTTSIRRPVISASQVIRPAGPKLSDYMPKPSVSTRKITRPSGP